MTDAMIDSFAAGVLRPTAEDVAARSGVSLRSVYRYFARREELVEAAMERYTERLLPFLVLDGIGEGDLADRVDRFVDARMRLYEVAAPIVRAARAAVQTNPAILDRYEARTTFLTDQLARHFAPELDALPPEAAAAADVLSQFDGIDFLRVNRGLTEAQAASTLRHALLALLRPPTSPA